MESRRNFLGIAAAAVGGGLAFIAGRSRSASAGPLIPPDITQGGQSYLFTSPTDGAQFRIWSRVDYVPPAPSPTPTATATATPTPSPTPPPITIGDTPVFATVDSGNANVIFAQVATLSVAARLDSLSFFVETPVGKLRLGIYDASGPNGGPGTLRAAGDEMTPVVGWNTAPIAAMVVLPAATYFLAYLTNDNALAFRVDRSSGATRLDPFPYGPLPANFIASSDAPGVFHWSFYATLSPV